MKSGSLNGALVALINPLAHSVLAVNKNVTALFDEKRSMQIYLSVNSEMTTIRWNEPKICPRMTTSMHISIECRKFSMKFSIMRRSISQFLKFTE